MDKKWLLFCVGALLVILGSFFKITHHELLSKIVLPVGLLMEASAIIWILYKKVHKKEAK